MWWPEDVADLLAQAMAAKRRGDAAGSLALYADAMKKWQNLTARVMGTLDSIKQEVEGDEKVNWGEAYKVILLRNYQRHGLQRCALCML